MSTFSSLLPSRPPFPSASREQGYSWSRASPGAKKRKQRQDVARDARVDARKKNRLPMPGAYREPAKSGSWIPPAFSLFLSLSLSVCLAHSLGCGSFAYGRGQDHPTGFKDFGLGCIREDRARLRMRLATGYASPSARVACTLVLHPRVYGSSRATTLRSRVRTLKRRETRKRSRDVESARVCVRLSSTFLQSVACP